MASVEDLVKDLDEKMGSLRTRQSRRDQFLTEGTKEILGTPTPEPSSPTDSSNGGHGDVGQDIYLGNLPNGLTEMQLRETFGEFNPIRARVLNHGDSNYAYGFIKLPGMTEAKGAVMLFNGKVLHGNILSVRICRDQSRARIIEEGVTRGMARSELSRTMTIHVGNVAVESTQEEMSELFADFGGVAKLSLSMTRAGNRQYARVTLRSETLVQQAIQKLNGSLLHGINITLDRFKDQVQRQNPRAFNRMDRGGAHSNYGGMLNGHHMSHGAGAWHKPQHMESLPAARRLIQKIEVLSSEVLDSCDFCQRLQSLIHELQGVINNMH